MVAKLSLLTRIKTWLLFECIRYHQRRIDKIFNDYKKGSTKRANNFINVSMPNYTSDLWRENVVDLDPFYKVSPCSIDVDILNKKTKKEKK